MTELQAWSVVMVLFTPWLAYNLFRCWRRGELHLYDDGGTVNAHYVRGKPTRSILGRTDIQCCGHLKYLITVRLGVLHERNHRAPIGFFAI